MRVFFRREMEKGLSLYSNLIGIEVHFYSDAIDVKLVSSIVRKSSGYGLVLFWIIEQILGFDGGYIRGRLRFLCKYYIAP